MMTENTLIFSMFLAVVLFFPLISKTMHLSKKVQGTIFEEYWYGYNLNSM